jgi:microcystin-dependent protein
LWTFLQTLATKVELGGYISSLSAALITPSIDMGSGQIDTALADSSGVNASWVQDVLDQYRKGFMPVGTMVDYGGTVAPSGWLLCQGQLLLRSAYPDLFTVLGTQYNIGGEAITHFRLPDTRGRVTVSPDTSAGRLTAAAANGSSGGSATVTLSTPNLPSHTHGFDGAGVLTTVEVAPTAGAVIWPVNDPGYYRLRDATEATGSDVPFSVLQPYTTATKMIYTGV